MSSGAEELLGRPARIGTDFAFTEIVHCKSRSEIGVAEALDTCAERYAHRVLRLTSARVLVVFGDHARRVVEHVFPETRVPSHLAGPIMLEGRERVVAFLPHPNAFQPKTFAKCMAEELPVLRAALY